MLIQFSVTNYRSFRDENTLSLVAAKITEKGDDATPQGVFDVDNLPTMLTSAVIFGANASGKSNFLDALWQLRSLVFASGKSRRRMLAVIEHFRLNREQASEPIRFEIVFRVQGTIYRYGLAVLRAQIHSEWLFSRTKVRESVLFERDSSEIRVSNKFGKDARSLTERTREDAPFLSVAAEFNNSIARSVVEWFDNSITFVDSSNDEVQREVVFHLKHENSEKVLSLVKRMDLSILDAMPHEISWDDWRKSNQQDTSESKNDPNDPNGKVLNTLHKIVELVAESGVTDGPVKLSTVHQIYDSNNDPDGVVDFDFDDHESDGTRRLFVLASWMTKTLSEGGVIIVDEIDSRIHTHLTRLLIKLFQDPESNPKHAQLICAAHDTNLLDSAGLRRDQIWFTDKNYRGESSLYSLVEFRGVRNDKALERGYLKGEFGAVPIVKDVIHRMVGADVVAQEE